MKRRGSVVIAAIALALTMALSQADESTHEYEDGEPVTLWLCKVGPYHNPQEAYSFYTLPYCAPPEELHPRTRLAGLGELIEGTELVNSDLKLNFKGMVDCLDKLIQKRFIPFFLSWYHQKIGTIRHTVL